MFHVGKQIRYDRIVRKTTGKTLMIPFDHGVFAGPISGIYNVKSMVKKILLKKGVDALIFHPGLAKFLLNEYGNKCSSIFKLTNHCTDVANQVLISSVEEAIKLGGDAVSVEIHLGSQYEDRMLENTRIVSESCQKWGIPLLIMAYVDKLYNKARYLKKNIKHIARASAEIGADIVKIENTGDIKLLKEVVASCPAPVVVAGGDISSNIKETFQMIRDSMNAGAIGMAIGRNIWQSKNPTKLTVIISKIIHNNFSVKKAMDLLNT